MTTILVFIFGLLVGSFLNAVIHRLHTNESFLSGRSKCPSCKHLLSASDLIPVVSFLILRGRCRYCGKKISWQYPTVELATAISFVLLIYNLQPTIYNLNFWASFIFICVYIVIAVFDFKHYLILDKVVFPFLVLSLLLNIYSGTLLNGLLGALSISGFFLLQYGISKGNWIGFGDVKLGLLLGSSLGLNLSVLALVLAYLSGALIGVTLMVLGRKKLSSRLPFGTFLAFSAIITLIYGNFILDWYLKLIGFR